MVMLRSEVRQEISLRSYKVDSLVLDIHNQITDLRTDVMTWIERLKDALTEQRESDVANFSAADRAENTAKDVREQIQSLGEQMTEMVKMLRRLQTRVDKLEEGRGEGSL